MLILLSFIIWLAYMYAYECIFTNFPTPLVFILGYVGAQATMHVIRLPFTEEKGKRLFMFLCGLFTLTLCLGAFSVAMYLDTFSKVELETECGKIGAWSYLLTIPGAFLLLAHAGSMWLSYQLSDYEI